jgi:hypothetical protein
MEPNLQNNKAKTCHFLAILGELYTNNDELLLEFASEKLLKQVKKTSSAPGSDYKCCLDTSGGVYAHIVNREPWHESQQATWQTHIGFDTTQCSP